MKLLAILTLSLPFADGRRNLSSHKLIENEVEPIESTKHELEPSIIRASFTDIHADKGADNNIYSDQSSPDLEPFSDFNAETYDEALNLDFEEFLNAEAVGIETKLEQFDTIAAVESGAEERELRIENKESKVEGNGDNDKTVIKNRRHFLRRRKDQYCSIQCFDSVDCSRWANAQPSCNSFRTCQGGVCVGDVVNRCSQYCQNDNNCSGASDGCTSCIGNQCVYGNRSGGRCGWNCFNDFNICNAASDGCGFCNGSTCVRPNKCNIGCSSNSNCAGAADGCTSCVNFVCRPGGINRCGQFCAGNPWVCTDATDGCNTCNGNNCVSSSQQICGSPCVGTTCSTSSGCNLCQNGFCVSNRNGGGCVSTESTLRSQLQIGGTVDICANSVIVVSSEISASASNIVLRCASGQCTIQGGGSNRMLNFSGDNVSISNISFRSGRTTGSGGALVMSGNNNRLTSCTFTGNSASDRGGAAVIGSGQFEGNTFSGNSAAQCFNIFISSTGRCFG